MLTQTIVSWTDLGSLSDSQTQKLLLERDLRVLHRKTLPSSEQREELRLLQFETGAQIFVQAAGLH